MITEIARQNQDKEMEIITIDHIKIIISTLMEP